jgi:CHAT domain
MNNGYDFRIKLAMDGVSCKYDTPERPNRSAGGALRPEPYLRTTKLLEEWLKRWERIALMENKKGRSLLVPETFNVLGDHLWQLALDNDVGNRLIDAYKAVKDKDDEFTPPIRVRISIEDDAAKLATLPWEFVRFPGRPDQDAFHLAAVTNLVFARYVADAEERGIRCAENAVRVLFIMSLPDTHDTEEEQKRFRWMISDLEKIGGQSLEILRLDSWQPREVSSIFADLKRKGLTIDVVHLVALCRGAEAGPQLLLPSGSGGEKFQDPAPVVQALTEDRQTRPELVVLHLGDWRGDTVPEHFERLAPAFIRPGIPAILAMQYPMTPPEGPTFVLSFYRKLMEGAQIGQAVQAARHDLIFGSQVNRHFGAPVLYIQSARDGSLLRASDLAEPGLGEGWARESTKADPSSQRAAASAANDIRLVLLDWVADCSPDAYIAGEIENWIEAQQWPDDLGIVWKAIQMKARSEDDNKTKAVYTELMRRITRMIADRGSQ